MKQQLKYLWICVISILVISCSEDEGLQNIPAELPSNLDAEVSLTQDNSGLVTVSPTGQNANSFYIDFGDGSSVSDTLAPGNTFTHTYEEGSYDMTVFGANVAGETANIVKPIDVSFTPPENVEVLVENDGSISNTVNVTANADFATNFEVEFGEETNDSVLTGDIGETLSYTYQSPGVYTITVTVMGASSEVVTYVEEDFEVTEVLQPTTPAPVPDVPAPNVIAIYSDEYTTITTNEFPTEWSDVNFSEIEIDGDNIINYSNLAFTGIVTDYENPTDLTGMDFIHFDYWTTDATSLGFKMVNTTTDPVQEDIVDIGSPVQGEWVSVDIPLDDYEMDRSKVTQLLFDALGNNATVFIDNIYFYTDAPTEPLTAAPEPTTNPDNVISIYSDTYTSITTNEFPAPWSGSGFEEIQIEGNNTIKYSDFDFTGIVTDYENPTDITAMTHVHFDYWTPDGQELGLKLVNTVLDPVQEDIVSLESVELGQWVSVDISLDEFDMDRSQITQLILDNLIPDDDNMTLFIDNFYFYN